MVTRGIFERVFKIKCAENVATCFAIEVEQRQYVVTARHVIDSRAAVQSVQLFCNGVWANYESKVVGKGDGNLDVAVLAFDTQLCPPWGSEAGSLGLAVGQDVYFLGFPYGLHAENDPQMSDFPLALVKKGVVSAFVGLKPHQTDFMLLDGHNNPGFSGGPVVYCASSRIVADKHSGAPIMLRDLRVCGVISGYRYEWEPVFERDQPTKLRYRYNTGIVPSVNIYHAVRLIKNNPIGALIDPQSARTPGTWLGSQGYPVEAAVASPAAESLG